MVVVDLPGHGVSPLDRTRPGHTPGELADSVAGLLDDLGLATVHLGGNSLGGWVALELAKRGRARTVTVFSPAGLWKRSAPAYIRASLRQSRVNARVVHRLAPNAPRTRLARALPSRGEDVLSPVELRWRPSVQATSVVALDADSFDADLPVEGWLSWVGVGSPHRSAVGRAPVWACGYQGLGGR